MSGADQPWKPDPIDLRVSAPRTQNTRNAPVIDDRSAPEVLIDGICGVTVTNTVLRLSLFAERLNAGSNEIERVVIARLAMPAESANIISAAIRQVLEQLVAQGLIPPLQQVLVSDAPVSS
jgi:hypothetical protein